ncbi:MAG TPA: biotin-dependent carboxyltransferase family protein [Rudaea sp.]|jgi:antagonist of KipI|nr:biotin-dependent carboxyltransferase family protein [Rudaea sp.]
MSVRVLSPGWLTSVQDSGRIGHSAIGVGRAGAMDDVALRLANALVGNTENAAALEITLRGPRLRFDCDALIALTGAAIDARCASQEIPPWRPVWIQAGSELDLGGMRRGARSYLAVAGGIDVATVLGSRSTDINAVLGPFSGRGLVAGDDLPFGKTAAERLSPSWSALGTRPSGDRAGHDGMAAAHWSLDPQPWFDARGDLPVALARGSHFECLGGSSRRALFASEFRVGNESNRVGYRLESAKLKLDAPVELISEGVVPGTMQLPPNGNPIVLMAEAPTTGGYPRIGMVATVDLPRLAQRRPGDHVRFVETSLAQAQTRYLQRERALAALIQTITERLQR